MLAQKTLAQQQSVQTAKPSVTWGDTKFDRQFVSVNGIRIHVLTAGKGEPVLLLHGYPDSGHMWRYVAPELAKKYSVIVPDLRGWGESDIPKDGYLLSNVAEDMHQLVQKLGHKQVKVVSHDWGAAVGYVYAARYRDEVTKLAFIEGAAPGDFKELWDFRNPNPALTFVPFLLMGDVTEQLVKGREEVFLRHLWTNFVADKAAVPFSDWQPYVKALKRPGAITAGAQYYRQTYESAKEAAEFNKVKLSTPVLAMGGEKSFGEFVEVLAHKFADNVTTAIVVPGSGHFIPEEKPRAVTDAMLKFLAD